jgi:hypothetical protein
MTGTYSTSSGQTLNNDSNNSVLGNVIASGGSTVSGRGTFQGNLTALNGSVVRVGLAGLSAPMHLSIDDFESYSVGDVRSVASPPWTAHQNTSLADVESDAGNHVLTYGWANDFRGVSRPLPTDGVLENDEVGTFFFRFNSKTDDPDHNFGLADQADTNAVNFGDYEAQVRLRSGTPGTFEFDARDGIGFTDALAGGLPTNTWHNVWMVVDQTSDTYDIYLNTGTADATAGNKLNAAPLAFRNGTSDGLNQVLALAGAAPIDNAVRYDDLFFLAGVDLTNPLNGFDPGLLVNPETMTIAGDFMQLAGNGLQLDIYSPTILDRLIVEGTLSAGGRLEVALDPTAPAPQLGDVFPLLDFESASGTFQSFDLPSLMPGLAWNVSNLLTTGELSVAVDVDLDDSGLVDGRDLLKILTTNPSMIPAWESLFGAHLITPASAVAVPEPAGLALALCGCWGLALLRRTWRLS